MAVVILAVFGALGVFGILWLGSDRASRLIPGRHASRPPRPVPGIGPYFSPDFELAKQPDGDGLAPETITEAHHPPPPPFRIDL